MTEREINRKIFYASPIIHNGLPSLLIRKILSDKAIVKDIALEILHKGVYEFRGVLIFRNPLLAINNLNEIGLIDFKAGDLIKWKYKQG